MYGGLFFEGPNLVASLYPNSFTLFILFVF